MPLVAPFKDGEFITNTASSQSINNAKEGNKSGIDSEAFLTLLVAEMQNQDPLEPTSNTEWISQYATFTQVSEIQEIGNDMQSMKAQDLVGQHVIMKVTDVANGESDYVSGKVDYVVYEEGKAYLSINSELYSIDDLDTVASKEYMEAYDLANEVVDALKKLPTFAALTTSNKKEVLDIHEKIENMNKYQRGFIEDSVEELADEYYNRMLLLMTAEQALSNAANNNANNTKPEENVTNITNNTTNITNVYNSDSSDNDSEEDKVTDKTENTENNNSSEAVDKSDNTGNVPNSDTTSETDNSNDTAVAENTVAPAENNDSNSTENKNNISEEIVDALTKDLSE